MLQGPLRRLFVGIGCFEAGNAAATSLVLRATEQLATRRPETTAVTLALILNAGYNAATTTVTSIPAGPHVDRTDARRVLTMGVAAFAPVATNTSDHIRGSAFGLGPHTERS